MPYGLGRYVPNMKYTYTWHVAYCHHKSGLLEKLLMEKPNNTLADPGNDTSTCFITLTIKSTQRPYFNIPVELATNDYHLPENDIQTKNLH